MSEPAGASGEAPRWLSLHVTPARPERRDGVIAALFRAGSQGVQEDGETVVTHFPRGSDLGAVRALVRAADPDAVVREGTAPMLDWSSWRARVAAHEVGRFTIAPPWLATGLDPERAIVIDPAMAFGTGEHPTTRGVLRLLQQVVRPRDAVADLGAGSAVLSIAAARLGARSVAAIELEPDAAASAEANIARNGVDGVVHYIVGDAAVLLPLVAPVRVVLANIVSSVLAALLPAIRDALAADGAAVLGGMLLEERGLMLDMLERGGWVVTADDVADGWWSAAVARA